MMIWVLYYLKTRVDQGEWRMESKNKKYPPQAFKFFLEQHVENVVKYYDDRRKQRMQLEQEMGETYISLAYVNLKQFVDLNVLDCCESATSALTRAAILQAGMVSTWRLPNRKTGRWLSIVL